MYSTKYKEPYADNYWYANMLINQSLNRKNAP